MQSSPIENENNNTHAYFAKRESFAGLPIKRGLNAQSPKAFKRRGRIGSGIRNLPERDQVRAYEPHGRESACLLMIIARKRIDALLWQDAWKSVCNWTAIPILTWAEGVRQKLFVMGLLRGGFVTQGHAGHRYPEKADR
jgi:hypothetical protein